MNVDRCFKRGLWMAVLAAMTVCCGSASAKAWIDQMMIPVADPLKTMPPLPAALSTSMDGLECETLDSHGIFSRPLTLADALTLALCHHPALLGARATIQAQAAQLGESRAAYLPSINLRISRQNQRSRVEESRFTVNSAQNRLSEYATLSWRLLDFGGRNAQQRSSNALLESALASHDAALQKIIASMAGSYFDAQSARASYTAREQHHALARQTVDTAQKRAARGAGMLSDTLQARTALARAELESSRALAAYEKSLAAMVLTLGLPPSSPHARGLTLAPDSMEFDTTQQADLSSWLLLASTRHPALLAARAQRQAAREKLDLVRSEGLPEIDLTLSHYLNGRPGQSLSAAKSTESVIGVTLNFPLFEGFSRTYKMRGQMAQIERSDAALQETENQILFDVRNAYTDAQAALRNLGASGRLMVSAQQAMEDVRLRFERGIVDILDMLNVQRALADAQQEQLRSQADWRSARLRLLANSGVAAITDAGMQR